QRPGMFERLIGRQVLAANRREPGSGSNRFKQCGFARAIFADEEGYRRAKFHALERLQQGKVEREPFMFLRRRLQAYRSEMDHNSLQHKATGLHITNWARQ